MSIPIPEDQMRAAYARRKDRSVAGPASWPDTFELAMCSPFYSRLVRLEALHGEKVRVEGISHSDRTMPRAEFMAHERARGQIGEGQRYWWHDKD